MGTAPGPSCPCTAEPSPMPRVTPIIIWMARWARSTLLVDNDTAAAIGAKNGCGWPSRSWVRYQDTPAATAVCTRLNHTARNRLPPARAATRTIEGTACRAVPTG